MYVYHLPHARLLLIGIALLLAVNLHAQRLLKQQKLSRWDLPAANYSGLATWGENRYAMIDDKSTAIGFLPLQIIQNERTGKIRHIQTGPFRGNTPAKGMSVHPDLEDIAFVPEWQTFFIASEATQQIWECDTMGQLTGRQLHIPEYFSTVKQNGGFESITYDSSAHRFWTTTENPLPEDSSFHRILCFGDDLAPQFHLRYLCSPPQLKKGKFYAHGISSLLALPDGRLLVMERELSVPARYIGAKTLIHVFVVQPNVHSESSYIEKKELFHFTTHLKVGSTNFGNYEGMALGCRLTSGKQTLLLVSDSQAGAGNKMLHLKDYIKVIILPDGF